MENETLTASEILDRAANLLEEENRWAKKTYISFRTVPTEANPAGCSMCAHGAIAYCGSLEVQRAAIIKDIHIGGLIAINIPTGAGSGIYMDPISDEIRNNPLMLAHYTAASVGLTFDYNDDLKTTQVDVVRKLRSAAQIVRNNYGV